MINSTLHDQNILRLKFYLRLEIDCWNFLIMNLHVKLWCADLSWWLPRLWLVIVPSRSPQLQQRSQSSQANLLFLNFDDTEGNCPLYAWSN